MTRWAVERSGTFAYNGDVHPFVIEAVPDSDHLPDGREVRVTVDRLINYAIGVATEHSVASPLHGPDHWLRVEAFGRVLAERVPGADAEIVQLFAVLHDTRRHNDEFDPDHGRRAASLARKLSGTWFKLSEPRLAILQEALARHADGLTTDDPTVGASWDADRLDMSEPVKSVETVGGWI